MIKNLRSLIQERFSLELRVQIELLSRRRDLVNEEKHQELIKLLRSFNVEGVVPLGPGTNRYAFKLGGFVIKVATDHDGKIDNLKEFKMAKRLYPHVTKTYEVSENGTLLVAEYIQPFASYSEMCKYADPIRAILTKLSTVYLIGDVGITSKNYSNWGLRVGTNDPVCLDFAYVYEISSELFICRNCNTNSMLLPNKDFTELYCPSPGCNKHYRFEDIRSRIGNDIHRHEIGDLSQEGYELTDSNVITELDDNRSNYLARKKTVVKQTEKSTKQEEEFEPFVMEHPPSYYMKEDKKMNIFQNSMLAAKDLMRDEEPSNGGFNNGNIIRAVAVAADPKEKIAFSSAHSEIPNDAPKAEHVPVDEGVAFSGIINPNIPTAVATPVIERVFQEEPDTTVLQRPTFSQREVVVKDEIPEPVEPTTASNNVAVDMSIPQVVDTPKKVAELNNNFLNNTERAFSKLANRIGNYLHAVRSMDVVKTNIRDRKMFPETFYKQIQNAVFRSLVIFCDFEEKEVINQSGEGTHKAFIPPTGIIGMPYEPTMIFASRFWNNRDINSIEEADEIMIKYRDRFSDYRGIQREWLPILEQRIIEKMSMDKVGVKKIVEIIANDWCITEEDHLDFVPKDETNETVPIPMDIPEFKSDELVGTHVMKHSMEEFEPQKVEVAQNPTEYDEEYEDGDEEPEGTVQFSVEIFYEDDFDIVKINSGEAFGPVSIPFYTKMESIKIGGPTTPSIADDRNGVWDWLIHMVPDMMFETTDPERWLEFNEYCDDTDQTHVVIMEERGDKYIMGVYQLFGIFIVDDDGESHPTTDPVILAKINKLVREDIGYSNISHLRRSLAMEELIRPEEYVSQMVTYVDEDPDDFDENPEGDDPGDDNGEPGDPDDESDMTDIERAAIQAVMNTGVIVQTAIVDDKETTTVRIPKTSPTTIDNVTAPSNNHIEEPDRQETVIQEEPEEVMEIHAPDVPEIPRQHEVPHITKDRKERYDDDEGPVVFQPIRRRDRDRDRER